MSDGIAAAKARAMAKAAEGKTEVVQWEPWVTYAVKPDLLPIAEPPCKGCAFWQPIRRFNPEFNTYIGVQLCHGQMAPDFSCFRPKE